MFKTIYNEKIDFNINYFTTLFGHKLSHMLNLLTYT